MNKKFRCTQISVKYIVCKVTIGKIYTGKIYKGTGIICIDRDDAKVTRNYFADDFIEVKETTHLPEFL